jgi:hypothetical protein
MILSISEWWSLMNLSAKIFWCIAVPFSLLFVIQMLFSFFGGDIDDVSAEGDVDAAIDNDMGIDFQFITLKNLIAFFTIFGWTGIICVGEGLNPAISTVIASAAGLVMMFIMAGVVYMMGKLAEEGTLNLNNAKGKTATVYLTIPAKRMGVGKVQIEVQGLQTLDAITEKKEDIPTGAVVKVVDVLNNQVLIVE